MPDQNLEVRPDFRGEPYRAVREGLMNTLSGDEEQAACPPDRSLGYPYVEPYFGSGFMNNKADFAPIRWSCKKTREVARRMDAFRGELTSHHSHFHPASPAATKDIDIRTAKCI